MQRVEFIKVKSNIRKAILWKLPVNEACVQEARSFCCNMMSYERVDPHFTCDET